MTVMAMNTMRCGEVALGAAKASEKTAVATEALHRNGCKFVAPPPNVSVHDAHAPQGSIADRSAGRLANAMSAKAVPVFCCAR